MTISHLLNESCTLIQRRASGMQDRLGNPIMRTEEVEISKSHFQSVSGIVGTNGVYYTGRGYLDAGVDVKSDDCIRARGKQYWVNSVQLHQSPIGTPAPYISLELRETEERQCSTNQI